MSHFILLCFLLFSLIPAYGMSGGAGSDTVTALQHDGTVYIRSGFSERNDIVIQIGEGGNGQVTFLRSGLVPVAAPMNVETCEAMFIFHVTPDESAPWKVNGSYIGAGHGWSGGVLELEEAAHGLQESDLGSGWKDAVGRPYILIRIPDPDRLWLMPENRGSLTRWNFDHRYQSPFRHVDGRTLSGESLKRVQLLPSLRFLRKTYQIDGTTPLQEGEPVTGRYLEVVDEHDIINPAAVIEAVMVNPGQPTNFVDPDLSALLTNTITYRFEPGGHCLIRQSSTIRTDLTLDYAGFIQTSPLVRREGDTLRVYIPGVLPFDKAGTHFDFQALQDYAPPPGEPLHFSAAVGNLGDPQNPPHRFIQLLETRRVQEPMIGYAVGYSLLNGITTPKQRAANCKEAAFIHTSAKIYPIALDAQFGPLYAGTTLEAIAYRRYFSPRIASDHATVLYWHREGEDAVVYGDYHHAVAEEAIQLPAELAGARVEILEASPSVQLLSNPVLDQSGLRLSISGDHGSFVLKLTK